MAKNFGEDLFGNESDACSSRGAKRRDGAILLSPSKGCNICSKCIAKGYQMLIENDVLHDEAASRRKEQKNTSLKFEDLLKPNEIKEFLDQYVIGQDDAKRYMSVAVYNHYKRLLHASGEASEVELDKSNILLVGPTGTGKTLMARTIANLLNVPFTIVDATVLTEAGYVGEDVESILSRLLQVASYDVELAQRGIVFIDEIDKIARGGETNGADVSREGVQRDLLPLIEGTSVKTKYGWVRTDHVLFICSGVFHLSKLSDLVPELQGRLPIRVELKSLTCEDFERILTSTDVSIVKQYQALLAADGAKVTFTDEAIKTIARYAFEVNERTENIGARRLHTVMEKLLEEVSFDAGNRSTMEVAIDEAYVTEHLGAIAGNEDLSRYVL